MKPILAIALCTLAACASRIGHDKQEDTYSAFEGSHEVEIRNRDVVLSELKLVDPISRRVDDRLQVELAFQNTANYKVKFEFQVRWYNGSGEKPFDVGPWRPAFLEAGASKPLLLTAPTPTCVGWQLATRAPHTSN